MNIRLTADDMAYVRALQKHFAQLEPIGTDLSNADVVRLGLRTAVEKARIPSKVVQAERDTLKLASLLAGNA